MVELTDGGDIFSLEFGSFPLPDKLSRSHGF